MTLKETNKDVIFSYNIFNIYSAVTSVNICELLKTFSDPIDKEKFSFHFLLLFPFPSINVGIRTDTFTVGLRHRITTN
jgi:hypothetical protein